MRDKFLDYIECPRCKGNLRLEAQDLFVQTIYQGALHCVNCNESYEVRKGVPRFLDKRNTSEFNKISQKVWFSHWNKFGVGKMYAPRIYSEDEIISNGIIGQINPDENRDFDLSLFKDKVVVDLGGGVGHNIALPAWAGAKICIYIDSSESVDIAYESNKHFPNAEFVQSDIACTPLRNDSVDFIFSIGVLHHVEDVGKCLRDVNRILNQSGYFAFTVLKKENWLGYLHLWLNPFKKILLKIIPQSIFLLLSYLLAIPLKGIVVFYKISNKVFSNLSDKFLPYNAKIKSEIMEIPYYNFVGFWYDVFIAPVYRVFSRKQWIDYLEKNGFRIVKFNDYGQKGYAPGVFWKIVVKRSMVASEK